MQMTAERFTTSRRRFLQGGLATAAAAGMMPALGRTAWGQSFPSRNMDVVIPTQAGGGADRLYRSFTSIWSRYLGTDFEVDFFPGASGRAGYETYINNRERDPHNLLFGNMGPELAVLTVQETPFSFPQDFQYFSMVDVDPSILYVAEDSPFQTIDDVIEEGQRRPLSTATSRIPHPASIGALLLGEETGAEFNLVPFAGGRNTIAAVVTGETDIGVLPAGGVIGAGGMRILLMWDDTNPIPELTNDAPTMNDHFGTDAPPLVSARAFAMHTETIENYPEAFELLERTSEEAFNDPDMEEAFRQAGQPIELVKYGNREECTRQAEAMLELAERFKPLLTGEG
jgi:tripartite-type tricarboxylate transporter receptor subunit TctC